jgi:hypothetical protein
MLVSCWREVSGLSDPTPGAAHPGPPPVAPLLPVLALQRLVARLEDLLDELDRARQVHDDAFLCITNDRFTGAAGREFRAALAGQLRRARDLEEPLQRDLDHVRWLLAQARAMQDRHELATRQWERQVASWRASMLAGGHGPVPVPRDEPAMWARQRGLP